MWTLIFDPLAGPAGFNLVAVAFYMVLAVILATFIIERRD